VSIASTVDFDYAAKIKVFSGKRLTVYSVTPRDLIKLKLERFRKQDPEDIYAVIEKIKLPYEDFKNLVQDMLLDFIGNPRELALSAWIVVERVYGEYRSAFEAQFKHALNRA
jgi:hypothetical protein